MTAAERARRARELHEALNTAFPADNHDSLDEKMRVAMLTLSQEETLRRDALEATRARVGKTAKIITKPSAPARLVSRAPFWRRWIAALVSAITRRRPA